VIVANSEERFHARCHKVCSICRARFVRGNGDTGRVSGSITPSASTARS